MNAGHSSPSSKERTVPETAPTANRIAVPRAHLLARSRYSAPPVRTQAASAATIITGIAMPMTAKMMWNASDSPICQRA